VSVLFLSIAPAAAACPECRAQVNSGVYGPDFPVVLFVMLLPLAVLALVGLGVYYADDIRCRLKGRAVKWQTAQNARR
jgi:hypothetical protein